MTSIAVQHTGSLRQRVPAAIVFAGCAAILSVACWLRPSSEGLGTHEELGLPPCGFYAATGIPCATCGMTTAFTWAAHGRLVKSFITQPMGAVLAVATAAMVLVSGYALVAGASLAPLGLWLARPRVVLIFGVLIVAAWVYKIVAVTGLL